MATLRTAPDGYIAKGFLTIKDRSIPVDLPFSVTIKDDVAMMSTSTTLQRLEFGIGENMADESSLGFAVEVDIDVTAQRTEPE